MKNKLIYTHSRADGIFGEFFFEGSELPFCVTLAHAYETPPGSGRYLPKVPSGTYTCRRGMHTLGHPPHQHVLETFEILGIPGHSGLLFHPGNDNNDSEGCTLLGKSIVKGVEWIIVLSKVTFNTWSDILADKDEFELEVRYAENHQDVADGER